MAGENSKILLGLPNLPADTIEQKLWGEFQLIYTAIKNLLIGVSQYAGIDPPDLLEIAGMDPSKYMQQQNLARWYPTTDEPITRGQVVRATNVSGANRCALAGAGSGLLFGPGIGVANETKGAGQKIEIICGGMTDAIGGMVPGTLYYLSTTFGAIQNLRPVNPGEGIQPIGWAFTSSQLFLSPSSYMHLI